MRRVMAATRWGGKSNPNRWAVPSGVGSEVTRRSVTAFRNRSMASSGSVSMHNRRKRVCQLPTRQSRCFLRYQVDSLPGTSRGKMTGSGDDDAGSPWVDVAPGEQVPHVGESVLQVQREAQFGIGGAPGHGQGHPDLGRGRLVRQLIVVVLLMQRGRDGGHVCIGMGCVVRRHSAVARNTTTWSKPDTADTVIPARTDASSGPGAMVSRSVGMVSYPVVSNICSMISGG